MFWSRPARPSLRLALADHRATLRNDNEKTFDVLVNGQPISLHGRNLFLELRRDGAIGRLPALDGRLVVVDGMKMAQIRSVCRRIESRSAELIRNSDDDCLRSVAISPSAHDDHVVVSFANCHGARPDLVVAEKIVSRFSIAILKGVFGRATGIPESLHRESTIPVPSPEQVSALSSNFAPLFGDMPARDVLDRLAGGELIRLSPPERETLVRGIRDQANNPLLAGCSDILRQLDRIKDYAVASCPVMIGEDAVAFRSHITSRLAYLDAENGSSGQSGPGLSRTLSECESRLDAAAALLMNIPVVDEEQVGVTVARVSRIDPAAAVALRRVFAGIEEIVARFPGCLGDGDAGRSVFHRYLQGCAVEKEEMALEM